MTDTDELVLDDIVDEESAGDKGSSILMNELEEEVKAVSSLKY